MKWILIRHGKTQGNIEHRYIGCRTDEPLCETGKEALKSREYPRAARVFASPMLRCIQTAGILYPYLTPETIDDLRECDFGEFENTKNELEELVSALIEEKKNSLAEKAAQFQKQTEDSLLLTDAQAAALLN